MKFKKIFKSIFKSAEFKSILKQTLNYKKCVKEEWLKYLKIQKKNLILFIKQLNNKQILKRAFNRSSFLV